VQIATAALNGEALVEPEWKAECTSCVWRTSCHDELKVDLDHITLVPGITPNRARAHYRQGVRRIADLARFDWRTAVLVDSGIDVHALVAWAATVPPETPVFDSPLDVNKAREKGSFPLAKVATAGDALSLNADTLKYVGSKVHDLAGSIDRARANKIGKVFLGRGIQSVGINRSVYEQDMDIEDDNGYVYLIGVRTTGRKMDSGRTSTERRRGEGRFEFDAFVNWDKSEDGEARVFADFWAHIQKSREYAKTRKYAYRLYYYTDHEPSAFKRLAVRHAGKPGVPTVEEVTEFFKLKEVIDLYAVLVEQLVWPTESVKLKEVAKWVRFSWRDSDPSGDNSLAWYHDAVDHEDEVVREDNRQRLLEYNEDDVTAQVAIRDWLTRLGEARHPGKKLPNVSTLDRRFLRR
jgi:predicted RecB family nuclease